MRQFMLDAIMVSVTLSAIPMVVVALASGIVALVQAATQIQEQSITHFVKLCTFVVVVLIAGDWASSEIVSLFERSLEALDFVGKGTSR